MRFALICPSEPVADGHRIAQVEPVMFPVAGPAYWLECADGITADEWYFNTSAQQIVALPAPEPRTYAQLRAAEYPPVADYMDGLVKGDQAQMDAYIAACLAVKAKYPKPGA